MIAIYVWHWTHLGMTQVKLICTTNFCFRNIKDRFSGFKHRLKEMLGAVLLKDLLLNP